MCFNHLVFSAVASLKCTCLSTSLVFFVFLKQQYVITHNWRKICRRGDGLYKPLFIASIQQAVINIEQYLIKVTDIWVILVAFRTLLIFMWLRVRHCMFSVENKQTQSPLCSTIQNILEDHPFPPLLQSKGSQKPSHFLSRRTENIYVLQNRILPTKGRGKAWKAFLIALGQIPSTNQCICSTPLLGNIHCTIRV